MIHFLLGMACFQVTAPRNQDPKGEPTAGKDWNLGWGFSKSCEMLPLKSYFWTSKKENHTFSICVTSYYAETMLL